MSRILNNSLPVIIALIGVLSTYSQDQKILEKGDQQYEMYEYINAQNTYLKLVNKGHESDLLFRRLGNTYYFNSQYEEASKWYGKLIRSYGGSVDSEYYYRYAQTLKSVGDYKKADLYMKTFVKVNPKDKRSELFLKNRGKLEQLKRSQKKYSIKSLSMNSPFRDFGAAYYDGYAIFSSSRANNNEEGELDEWSKEPYLDFYIAVCDTLNKEFYDIKKWDLNLDLNESTPVFTKDYKTVYFTGNTIENRRYRRKNKGKTMTNELKIYSSSINKKGKWSKPKALPFCSDNYTTAHPALNSDETKMYFSSNMPGGKGEADIYVVDIDSDDSFGVPKNLGDIVNTEGKETFPFVTVEDNLFFSSDGHVGYGGLDVFVTRIKDIEKGTDSILNLGLPINSEKDDFAFVVKRNSGEGYFSSNRLEGKGKDDIYSFSEVQFNKGDDLSKKLELNAIYFDLDKSFIRPDASVILDQIVDIMNTYPQMEINIRSHTDSRASYSYNIDLSKRRARSTRNYLIEKGINAARIASQGQGEFELLNRCSNGVKCSEEEHQLNRRSEFIITKI